MSYLFFVTPERTSGAHFAIFQCVAQHSEEWVQSILGGANIINYLISKKVQNQEISAVEYGHFTIKKAR
jgi:hypothetical protein